MLAICDLVGVMQRNGCDAYDVMTVVMKNCEPLVSFPALAMERMPFLVCFSLKFSSANFSP
jgi:hypothetical protein